MPCSSKFFLLKLDSVLKSFDIAILSIQFFIYFRDDIVFVRYFSKLKVETINLFFELCGASIA